MSKDKDKEKVKIVNIKVNPKIEAIVKDYPEELHAHPRGSFENQLRKHLDKHGVK